MSTRGLIFIAGIIVGFFVGMLSFSSHGAGKLYGNCVHTCDNKNSKYNKYDWYRIRCNRRCYCIWFYHIPRCIRVKSLGVI